MNVRNFLIFAIVLNVSCSYYYSFSVLMLNTSTNDAVAFFSLIVLLINFLILRINKKINEKLNIWNLER